MSYLKSQNGDIAILMHKIVAVKVVKDISPSFDGRQHIVEKDCTYNINVICDGCAFNMASYPTKDDAVAIMNEIISRISKDKSYRIPLRKDDPVYEV